MKYDLIKTKTHKENKKLNWIIEWGKVIIVALITAVLVNKFMVFRVFIPSESMMPTLNVNDRLFIRRIYNLDNIKRGQIIVFYSEELKMDMIKRVIGLPGDEISIEDGSVSVNGDVINEPYVKNNLEYNGEFSVPEGEYFFLGDNRLNSKDSRYWENPYVPKEKIEGIALIRIYPFSDFGAVK